MKFINFIEMLRENVILNLQNVYVTSGSERKRKTTDSKH